MECLSHFLALSAEEKEQRGLQYTPAEIAQQPDTWLRTFEIFKENRDRLIAFLESAGVRGPVEKRPTVVLVGAGTSDYIGQAVRAVLQREWQCTAIAIPSTDLLPNMDDLLVPGAPYLLIHFSRSGDSPEGVAFLQRCMEARPDAFQLVVTCNRNAKMAALCSGPNAIAIFLDDAVNDRSLAMTSSFTNAVIMGQCLAHAWSPDTYQPILEKLVASGRRMLVDADKLACKAATENYVRVCFVGGSALTSVARESALKVLEMTAGGIKTMSETILGLRHGPMAALDRDTMLVAFVYGDQPQANYSRDLLQELRAKDVTRTIVAIGPGGQEAGLQEFADEFLAIDAGIPDAYRPPVDVMFGQLLGLNASVAKNLKPDAPSPGGVITRVVKGFQIY